MAFKSSTFVEKSTINKEVTSLRNRSLIHFPTLYLQHVQLTVLSLWQKWKCVTIKLDPQLVSFLFRTSKLSSIIDTTVHYEIRRELEAISLYPVEFHSGKKMCFYLIETRETAQTTNGKRVGHLDEK